MAVKIAYSDKLTAPAAAGVASFSGEKNITANPSESRIIKLLLAGLQGD